MAGKKQRPAAAETHRQNTPLLFLLLLAIPLYGGYYNFTALLCGTVLAVLLAVTALRSGALTLPVGPEAVCLYALCLCGFASIPFAVSAGMALTGALRTAVWALFFLCAATYTAAERADMLDAVAYKGAILSLIWTAAFLYDRSGGVSDANGRIDGPFQYANAWALFQLLCVLLLLFREKRRTADYAALAALLAGILLSGSRGAYLLLAGFALFAAARYVRQKRRFLPVLAGGGVLAVIGGAAVLLSRGLVWDRLRAITLSSSSVNGRLLYDIDGLRMLLRHPLGVGRGGYLYLQSLEQTGVYTLRFIHNEYLQAALDTGVLGGVCLAAFAALLLLRRAQPLRERLVILAVAAHALIDFDLQFSAVAFLLLLCGAPERTRRIALRRKAPCAALCGALAAVLLFFSGVYYLDFAGNAAAAYRLFPADLELAEKRLQSFPAVAEAETVADRINASTELSMLAWDCKLAAAAQRADLPGMAEAKYRYLRLNRYRGEVYEDFAALLENACAQGSDEERERYAALAQAAIDQLEEVEKSTDPLAYRIADKPDWGFRDEVLEKLTSITKKGSKP